MTSKEKTKSLLNKATTDDRNPPSGYLLKELASRTMSISECQTIEDLVIKKLAKSKPYVKYKSLRIVKYLCENGSPNWRRAWQRNTDKLRDAQQFRGPPDPVFGDAPYQQVRKAAKDAMQAVFQQSTIDSSHIKNRIKGVDGGNAYSSSSYTGTSTFGSGSRGVYGGSSMHKKDKAPSAPSSWDKKPMPGHGNTDYQPTVRTTTFEPLKSSGAYSNPAVLAGTNIHSKGKLDTRKSGKRKKGKAGGVWGGGNDDDDVEESEEDYSNTGGGGGGGGVRGYGNTYDDFPSSNTYEKPRKKIGSFGGNIKKRSKASSGQYEKKWVNDIVKSGGVGCKIIDLQKYVAQFENLSKNHVLEYLDEKLEDRQWQKKGKTLTLIEGLIKKGRSSDDVIEYFSQSPDNIQELQNAKKSILRKKANSIMQYLDIDDDDDDDDESDDESDEEEESINQQQQQQQQQQQNVDLLNIGNNDDDEDDMFADMNKEDEKQNKQQDLLGDDMFSNMNNTQTQQINNNTNDIMNIMAPTVTNTNTNTNDNKRKKSDYGFLDDLANETNVTQNNNNSILNVNNNKQQPQQQQQQSSSNSAFGFDLGGSGGDNNNVTQTNNNNNNNNTNNNTNTNTNTNTTNSAFGFDLSSGGNNQQTNSNVIQQTDNSGSGSGNGSGSGSGSSAFGFDLGGDTSSQTQNNQSMNQSMNTSMNNMNNRMSPMINPMVTQQMLASNMTNMAQMQQMMQQMQSMQMNMGNPQMNQMNMMNMMNQMNQQQQQQQQNQTNNLFTQVMANVNNPNVTQPQQRQTYVAHNDPFAQMMSGNTQQTTVITQRPKKTGPDPFAQFGLNSLK